MREYDDHAEEPLPDPFQPDPARVPIYDGFYHIYRDLYPALRASFRDLAEVRA